jgi:hypothetical protein
MRAAVAPAPEPSTAHKTRLKIEATPGASQLILAQVVRTRAGGTR